MSPKTRYVTLAQDHWLYLVTLTFEPPLVYSSPIMLFYFVLFYFIFYSIFNFNFNLIFISIHFTLNIKGKKKKW